MKTFDLTDKEILILGFAREGSSVLAFLRQTYPNKKFTIWDQSSKEKIAKEYLNILEKDKNVELKLGVGDFQKIKNWDKYDVIIKSAGIPLKNLPSAIHCKISSETQIFFDECLGEIIGITGTKGKSTTSSLIFEVLKCANKKCVLLGNIGKPALDYLDEIDKNTIIVFELSSHQLQTLTRSPHIAVILNIYPEHLDYYKSYSDYISAKTNIASFQTARDFLIVNEDFPELKKVARRSKTGQFSIGKKYLKEVQDLHRKSQLLGQFNQLNILAAKRVSEILGIDPKTFAQAVQNFKPLEHRLEFVGTFNKIKFYNDSIATIPEATIGAVDALGDEVETIFLGGFDRGVSYQILVKKIIKSKIKNLILFPSTGEKIWKEIKKYKNYTDYKVYATDNMKDAVKFAYEHTSPGKIALLSCASTSFNLFKNYADRGNQFKEQVVKLGKLGKFG